MTNSLRALGRSVGAFVEHRLLGGSAGDGPPVVRLKGFSAGEIPHVVDGLKESRRLTLPGHEAPPTIVVGRRGELEGVADEHLLTDERTLTWHRNNNADGLIIIELDAQSDEQGLTFIDTLADNDVFRDPESRDQRLRIITTTAWSVSAATGELPGVLLTELVDLFERLDSYWTPSLRRWVDFVVVVVSDLTSSRRAVTGPEVRTSIATHLQHLRMFPDDGLFERPSATARRLERNYHLAGLRTPQGRDVKIEDLETRIASVELLDQNREPLAVPELSDLRASMLAVLDGQKVADLGRVPLRIWEQLFERREPAVGLGAQIRDYLEQDHPTRVAEFDELEVEPGLDDGDADAAERLLRAENPDDDVALADELRGDLRRRVERLVFAGEQESPDPLRTILYGVQALDLDEVLSDAGANATVWLHWERLREDEGSRSARLFAFLYGPTLLNVAADADSGLGLRFAIDPELTTTGPFSPNQSELAEDDDLLDWLSTAWSPLRLTLKVEGAGTPLLRFRWTPEEHPGLVTFARLIEMGGVEAARIDDLDGFLAAALDVSGPLPLLALNERVQRDAEHTARWREAMESASRDWVHHGMTSDGLDAFLSEWFEILADAREALIPQGEPLPALDSFLTRDICPTASGTWVMLPTHPLRLRWLREHLKVMRGWLVDALAGELRLNPRNDSLFFEWVDNVSPHRQPAIISPADRQLATAAREEDWHEEYVPVGSANALTREAVLDDSSVEELVSACRHFLYSYPHKTDGVSLLLMLRGQDTRTPATFLNRLLQRDLADAVVTLHVLAPRSNHERIARSLKDFDSGHARATAMFPPVQLMLHSWDGDLPSALDELEGRVDLALAPNLFGVDIDALTETRARSEGVSGHFDPWLDPASHVRAGGGVNVSQIMLPRTPDPIAEAWSTLTVRRHRRAVVKMDDPRSTDFVTLQIRFDANRRLFEQLHSVAHWVVTLDPFVGRDQIDALDQRPDIILVREGVGKNETYTLVVSSGAGQRFVTRRLERRLARDLNFSEIEASAIAERLYEVGRDVCPGLMLRALGLGRSTEEILGLVAARYVCASDDPPAGDGVEFWLSLDELAHWFGGPQRSRPDLLRVRLSKVEGRTRLDLLVVESKFRRKLDLSIADQQLDAGVALLKGAFGFSDMPAHDALFWHRELHRAFRQLSRPDRQASDLPAVATLGRGLDDAEIDQALLRGEFDCEFIGSLVVAVAWNEESVSQDERTAGGHRLVALGRPAFRDLLVRLQEGEPPKSAPLPGREGGLESPPDQGPVEGDADGRMGESAVVGRDGDQPPPATVAPSGGLGLDGRENQYQRLLDRLDSLGVAVSRAEEAHVEGPRFAVYRVVPDASVPLDRVVGRTQELKLALGLPADRFVRAYVDRGSVVFEVPKEDEHSFVVRAEDLWSRTNDDSDALAIPLGVDLSDRVVEVDFSSADTPHLLIAGQTGSGKSVALETLLSGLCRRKSADQLRLHLVDPKGTELLDLADDPHVEGDIGYMPEDALEVLAAGVAEMERRYGIFRSHRARSLPQFNQGVPEDGRLPWWLIVLDEYADLTSDADDKRAIETELRRIAQKGRAAGIHLIVATQRPSADVIGTVIRANLPAQVALRVKSGTDSRLIIDEAGAETLAGKGDALFRTARGITRIQCALVTGEAVSS